MSKGWTDERRKAQAERCKASKPWKNATGPKTVEGKARASMNAFKHGNRRSFEQAKGLIKHHKSFLERALVFAEILGAAQDIKQARLQDILDKNSGKRTDKTLIKSMGFTPTPRAQEQTK